MKYVVTGGAGFIGSNIVEELVKKGEDVTVIDNLSYGKMENIGEVKDKIRFVKGDIRDFKLLKKEFKDKDYVIHQAALMSITQSFDIPEEYCDVNEIGTLNVLKAALHNKVKRVVFASSSSVYGECKVLPQKEEFELNPKSPYAKSKLEGEKLCEEYAKRGLETVSLRYFNVFGPKQNLKSMYSNVIPLFISSVLQDKQPTIYGNGSQSRDFIFIREVVDASIKACEENISGKKINIASGKSLTINQLLQKINSILEKNIQANYDGPRPGDTMHTLADISKKTSLLDIKEEYNFDKCLKETIEWFKKDNFK